VLADRDGPDTSALHIIDNAALSLFDTPEASPQYHNTCFEATTGFTIAIPRLLMGREVFEAVRREVAGPKAKLSHCSHTANQDLTNLERKLAKLKEEKKVTMPKV
jgi:hypothetical protein